jgi:hypothetical protein
MCEERNKMRRIKETRGWGEEKNKMRGERRE